MEQQLIHNSKDKYTDSRKTTEMKISTQLESSPQPMKGNIRQNSIKKPLASSTFLQHYENKMKNSRALKLLTQDEPSLSHQQDSKISLSQSKQLYSVRSAEHRAKKINEVTDNQTKNEFIDNLVRLKIEEMTFKFKSRIATMLREMGIAPLQMGRYSMLAKIEDVLDFLSEKIKEKWSVNEIKENTMHKMRSKEKETVAEFEVQLSSLQKRFEEKESNEVMLRNKLKEVNSELKILYEQVNLKEKQLTVKITELYQSRTLMKQAQKFTESLQQKLLISEQERQQLRDIVDNQNKSIITENKVLQEQISKLKEEVEALREELEVGLMKEKSLSESNKNLLEEVERWRERFQIERQRDQQHITPPRTPHKYQESLRTTADSTYRTKIKQLQAELTVLRQFKGGEQLKELQRKHNKQLQSIISEWRDKLTSIIDSYQNQKEEVNKHIQLLQNEKQELKYQIHSLESKPTKTQSTGKRLTRLGSFHDDNLNLFSMTPENQSSSRGTGPSIESSKQQS